MKKDTQEQRPVSVSPDTTSGQSNYADRLEQAVAACGNPCLVGLDPHTDLMPDDFAVVRDPNAPRAERADALSAFCLEIIDLVAGRVPAVKPQSALFERLGADGGQAWERVVAAASAAGLIVIGDVKRGDIGSTARAYAEAYLSEQPACDAITVNPYLGADSLTPFLELCRANARGIYVLVRTSNPSSSGFQLHGEPPLCDVVARAVSEWGAELVGEQGLSAVGAVVGATHPDELRRLRSVMPRTPLLLPGYGAQGAGAADIVGGFLDGHRGALVNSSRGILFAQRDPRHAASHWKDASRAALDAMISEITGALDGRS